MKRSDFLDEDDWMWCEGFRISAYIIGGNGGYQLYFTDTQSAYRKGIIAGLASAWGF